MGIGGVTADGFSWTHVIQRLDAPGKSGKLGSEVSNWVASPQYIPFISRLNNPLIQTCRDIQVRDERSSRHKRMRCINSCCILPAAMHPDVVQGMWTRSRS